MSDLVTTLGVSAVYGTALIACADWALRRYRRRRASRVYAPDVVYTPAAAEIVYRKRADAQDATATDDPLADVVPTAKGWKIANKLFDHPNGCRCSTCTLVAKLNKAVTELDIPAR